MQSKPNYIHFRKLSDTTYQIGNIVLDKSLMSFGDACDSASLVADLADRQKLKVAENRKALQLSENKLSELTLLTDELMSLTDQLAPIKTIYSTVNPSIFIELPTEEAQRNVNTGNWSYEAIVRLPQTVEQYEVV